MNEIYAIGDKFPTKNMSNKGAMELSSFAGLNIWDSFILILKDEKRNKKDIKCFNKGFKDYCYTEIATPVPVPKFIFNYKHPLDKIEVSIDAKAVHPQHMKEFLSLEGGGVKNALFAFLLDGDNTIKALKVIGLHNEAISLFHKTLSKQLALNYTQEDFLNSVHQSNIETIEDTFSSGKIFKFKKQNKGE